MPSANKTTLGFGILLFGLGISILTTGGIALFVVRLVRRVAGAELIVLVAVVAGCLLLAAGSAMMARSFN
ncbi:MAG TPA: hypothetical protein VGR71_07960 [Nitrospira sp.]|nr:hypothetical protein [Nitrospira sp.]